MSVEEGKTQTDVDPGTRGPQGSDEEDLKKWSDKKKQRG